MGSFLKDDKNWLLNITKEQRIMSPQEQMLIGFTFDNETNQDVNKIEQEMKVTKTLKKLCLMKTLFFIPEMLLTFLLFETKKLKFLFQRQKIYFKFLFNKMSLLSFENELITVTKNDIIL